MSEPQQTELAAPVTQHISEGFLDLKKRKKKKSLKNQ